MKGATKINIGIGALVLGTVASFAAALSSTIAWFAYSTRSSASLKGTSIDQCEQLQIGFVTDVVFKDEDIEKYRMSEVTDEATGTRYVFTAPGLGLPHDLIQYQQEHSGYAKNQLYPLTSNEYHTGESVNLKQSPISGHAKMNIDAENEMYSNIPFCFRVVKVGPTGEQIYVENQNIWLSNAKVEESDVKESVRCYFENGSMKFLLNPSDESTSGGATKVAGLLDLNRSGYFDTYVDPLGFEKELVYGEYDSVPTTTYFDDDSELDDVNGSGNSTEETTFTAKHKAGTYGYTDLTSESSQFTPKLAEYKTLSQIEPTRDESGSLSGGQVLCKTSYAPLDTNGDPISELAIAKLTMKVYVEGWDYSIINQHVGHYFGLGLTFEINKVS